jgi:hypothetical protein
MIIIEIIAAVMAIKVVVIGAIITEVAAVTVVGKTKNAFS